MSKPINEITYAINGAIFAVHNGLGPGFLEKVYEKALMLELKQRGLQAHCQRRAIGTSIKL